MSKKNDRSDDKDPKKPDPLPREETYRENSVDLSKIEKK